MTRGISPFNCNQIFNGCPSNACSSGPPTAAKATINNTNNKNMPRQPSNSEGPLGGLAASPSFDCLIPRLELEPMRPFEVTQTEERLDVLEPAP